jgi:hypothetical protein
MADQPFELRIVPQRDGNYPLALYQRSVESRSADMNGSWRLVVQVWGTPLRAVLDHVLAILKQAGYRPSDLYRSRRAPFLLAEELGVRLALLFLAVKPLRKVSRITEISEQVPGMAVEEAYYWFSKTTDHGSGRRSQKALRILLARE